jgi:glycine oxidase
VTAPSDVVVVGAGPVGAACARELALAGHRVHLIEAGEQGQGWRAAAGMLAPQIESGIGDPLLELGVAAREFYRPLTETLLETTGIDIGLWQEGIAAVAADETEAADFRSRVASQRQHGLLSDWLDAEEVQARWPWLRPTAGALWAGHDGALDPASLVRALLEDARRLGVGMIEDRVTTIERHGDKVSGVAGRRGRYAAGNIVLAGGAWSGTLDGLPRPLSVAPVRGQMVALPWPSGASRAIIYGRDCYVVARGDEAIAGSTMEYAGFRAEVTAEGRSRIIANLAELSADLSAAPITRAWSGLRPMTPDGMPILGEEPRLRGLWYATGHGRHGVLLAGLTGLLIRQLVSGEPPAEDLAPFAPDRFWRW